MRTKLDMRLRRKNRIRKRIHGTPQKPRLSVFRSARHIYAQVVDDIQGTTLVTASTQSTSLRQDATGLSKTEAAKKVGELLASLCKERNITQVVFDRNGYLYHGRVKALADSARAAGLKF